jgi:predicted AlkP superfamily phosphohydrolase/phosphomutase
VTRTIAIGLDGVSWNVLDLLLETGELPNLQRLRDEGAQGVLESTIPFFTGPAWASFATGCSPAAHGIYDFMMLREDGSLSVAWQGDLQRKTYYQQLGDEGKRSVLINLPLDQDGSEGAVIVNSWLTDDDARRILPVGRRKRYARLLSTYRTFPQNFGDIDELSAIEQARFDLARELFLGEDWDHFFVLFSSTDWLGHSATGSFLNEKPEARAAFLRLYRDLDRYVGWLVDHAPDATIALLSDHGQCEEEAVLRVNAVLVELGFAHLAHGPAENGGDPFFVSRREGARVRLGVPAALGRHRSNRFIRPGALLVKRMLRRGLGIEVTRAAHQVDRVSSQAYCPTDASFAIYTRDLSAEDIDRIREALLSVRLPDGRPAVENVWTPTELYGRSIGSAPTLLFSPAHGVRPSATIKEDVVSAGRAEGTGCHQRDGILMLAGPDVKPTDLGRCSMYDVAPTLLWAMGCGIPSEIDGRILFEAFDESLAIKRPVREVDGGWREAGEPSGAGSDEVTRRLKALGYI